MNEDAVASNRTYARIMMDELLYDIANVKGAKRIVEHHIQRGVAGWKVAVEKQAKKDKKEVPEWVKNANYKSVEELQVILPTMSFEKRKTLVSKIMSEQYKNANKVASFFINFSFCDGGQTSRVVTSILKSLEAFNNDFISILLP